MTLNNNNSTPPCDQGFFERLNYYFGKLITERDFKAEQNYFNEKRWLLNRRTIGWGVVCGLEVIKKENVTNQVIVKPGLALDQYGNDIVVCQEQTIEVIPASQVQPIDGDFYVCIKYKWCYSEPVPSPVEECGEYRSDCQYNRIRETFVLKSFEIFYKLTEQSFAKLRQENIPEDILSLLVPIKDIQYASIYEFIAALVEILGEELTNQYKSLILKYSEMTETDICDFSFDQKQKPRLDCVQFLEDPCPTMIESCDPRNQCSWLVLAKVIVKDNIVQDEIDNCTYRKLLLSNDMLYQTSQCLKEELWKVHTARIDRRQFVPLLAQTLKGLEYKEGRILAISELSDLPELQKDVGKYPFSITTDGEFIWFTDQESQENNFIKKLSRDGKTICDIPMSYPSWGIAFDGKYMWVTHIAPDETKGKISLINMLDDNEVNTIDLEILEAREIVFDGEYMWISHLNNTITKVDIKDPINNQENFDWTDSINAPITDLAFDGKALWVGYDTDNGLRKIEILLDPIEVSDIINIDGGNPQGICFDGTHIWVGHEGGASQVNIDLLKQDGKAEREGSLTRVTFDGMYLWALQPTQERIQKVEIFKADNMGHVDLKGLIKNKKTNLTRLCFDGIFIWVTAFVEIVNEKKGIIYRLLL